MIPATTARAAKVAAGAIRPLVGGPVRTVGLLGGYRG